MLEAWVLSTSERSTSEQLQQRTRRLLERLQEAPSPTGLLRELKAIAPHGEARSSSSATAPPRTSHYGQALEAMAMAMRDVALLDENLLASIDRLLLTIPAAPEHEDTVRIRRDANALRTQASPLRMRAISERQELTQLVGSLANAIGETTGESNQISDGLAQLATYLEQSPASKGLHSIQQETLRQVHQLQQEAEALRSQLALAQSESSTLQQVVDRQSQLLTAANEKARLDGLTGLLNRGTFDTAFKEQISTCRRERKPLFLILLDIDHFKSINDTWGHPVGDQVLRTVAGRLKQVLRNATVARVGGEEFAVLLAGVSPKKAFQIAERVRKDIQKQTFPTDLHAPDTADTFQITISAGMDQLSGNEDGMRFYSRVDKALYAAKQGGRNRVVVSGQSRT